MPRNWHTTDKTEFCKQYHKKRSAKKPEIKIETTAKGMTVNAGLVPVLRFMDALLLDKMISDMVSTPETWRQRKMSP
jgi:hypothetical protein